MFLNWNLEIITFLNNLENFSQIKNFMIVLFNLFLLNKLLYHLKYRINEYILINKFPNIKNF